MLTSRELENKTVDWKCGFMNSIIVKGASEHNLKNIDVEIPKNKINVFTGISGSGKSSLVFDTIYAEAFRRFLDSTQMPVFYLSNSSQYKPGRSKFHSISGLPPAFGISQRQRVASQLSTVGTITGVSDLFRVYFAAYGDKFCSECDIPLKGIQISEIKDQILHLFQDKNITISANLVEKRKGSFKKEIEKFLEKGFSKINLNGKIHDLEEEKINIDGKKLNTISFIVDSLKLKTENATRLERSLRQAVELGKGVVKVTSESNSRIYNTLSSCPQCGQSAQKIDPRFLSHTSPLGKCTRCHGLGSEHFPLPSDLFPCLECHGGRMNSDKPTVRILGKTIDEIQKLKFSELILFIQEQLNWDAKNDTGKQKIYAEISKIILTLNSLNLGHLFLNRSGQSLSPGDLQRVRLASFVSNHLKGALYVIDEPCQGLTNSEVQNLLELFKQIKEIGATLLCVEHHPFFLANADCLFLMGPGAGIYGGQIVSKATDPLSLKALLLNEAQKTNAEFALSSKQQLDQELKESTMRLKKSRKNFSLDKTLANVDYSAFIEFSDVSLRNLNQKRYLLKTKAINVLRGPSGSGKMTFIDCILLPYLQAAGAKFENWEDSELDSLKLLKDKYYHIKVTGNFKAGIVNYVKPGNLIRTSRRIVASALEVVVPLRQLFAKLHQSQMLGLTEHHFSWSSKLGKCLQCEGRGYVEHEQKYMQSIKMECDSCYGARLDSHSLKPRFKNYNFAEVMNLTLDQAVQLFDNQTSIQSKIERACLFGLGYIQLGQTMDMLSGGEIQRLNLTLELKRSLLEDCFFILIHPSTGLHTPDISKLKILLKRMVEKGATFVCVDNREEFLDFAENVLDF